MSHAAKVSKLQAALRESVGTVGLSFRGHSNTTRSKAYKKGRPLLDCSTLDQVLHIDVEKKQALVEPRVTMEKLVKATLSYGLMPKVVPEFKGITVGGAINGAAAESSSHRYGLFHDSCSRIEVLGGKGQLFNASPEENADLFYGLSGSYGSLGLLTAATLDLVPAMPSVHLEYTVMKPQDALKRLSEAKADFVDGICFSKESAVVIEGRLCDLPSTTSQKWYAQHVSEMRAHYEETMPLFDYLFRYDLGAFWMGAFLFRLPFLRRYITQGLFQRKAPQEWFSQDELDCFGAIRYPSWLPRTLARPFMHSQRLWSLLHKAERWVGDRLIIQDFCIPTHNAPAFLQGLDLFPIWLCPIRGTATPQLFAPHLGSDAINFGLYGAPKVAAPMEKIIAHLEEKTHPLGGRKVLYSRSYYTHERFWQIYPKAPYEALRQKTASQGVFHDITEKILSK